MKSQEFDPLSFPDATDDQRAAIAALGERLDATRRTALAEDAALTVTGLYNLVAKARAAPSPATPLAPAREAAVVRARARIVAKLHDDLDAAVVDAYGWGDDWRSGALPPPLTRRS